MSPTSRADILRDALRQGDYAEIISELEPQTDLSDEETALLGLALLRSGHFKRAELPLATAMARGDREAAVEYGNLLRVTNQTDRAIRQFEQLLPALEGELRYRALRWYGVSLFTSGHYRSIELIEEARVGYLGLGDQATAARISHTLSPPAARRISTLLQPSSGSDSRPGEPSQSTAPAARAARAGGYSTRTRILRGSGADPGPC